MNLTQMKIISQYKELYGGLSLKASADLTGIQITRLFRIFNGSKMRLDEYETLKSFIEKREQVAELNIEKLAKLCTTTLSRSAIAEVETLISRKLAMAKLCQARGIEC